MGAKDIKLNIIALLIGVLIAVFLGEVVIRVFIPQKMYNEYLPEHPDYEPYLSVEPELGWVPRKDFSSQIYGIDNRLVKITHNNIGTRNKNNVGEKKKIRILVMGDSFTYGWGVRDEDSYPAKLQKLLGDKYEVINFGVPSYEIDLVYIRLLEQGFALEPDVIIYGVYLNDFLLHPEYIVRGRDNTFIAHPTLKLLDGKLERLNLASDLVNGWQSEWDKGSCLFFNKPGFGMFEPVNKQEECKIKKDPGFIKHFYPSKYLQLYVLLKEKFYQSKGKEERFFKDFHARYALVKNWKNKTIEKEVEEQSRFFALILNFMNIEASKRDIPFVVMHIPDRTEIDEQAMIEFVSKYNDVSIDDFEIDRMKRYLSAVCSSNSIMYLSIADEFRKYPNINGLYGSVDMHTSAKANQIIAEKLYEFLHKSS